MTMIERAAIAAVNERSSWSAEGAALGQCDALPRWDDTEEICRDDARREARAAILAALDAEDEALVEHVARAMCAQIGINADDWEADDAGAKVYEWHRVASTARAAISALRSLVQGASQ